MRSILRIVAAGRRFFILLGNRRRLLTKFRDIIDQLFGGFPAKTGVGD